jgi:DNA polymerase
MQLKVLHKNFDSLHKKHGDNKFNSIYGAGETKSPLVCFVFMNPTARNVSATKDWNGLRAPWLGTKNVWKLFASIGIISDKLNGEIRSKKSNEWDPKFSNKVYEEIKINKCFITNLAKCTQKDAAHLPDSVFREYRDLMLKEIYLLDPKIIISFGNQVSSILLDKNINVSLTRKKSHELSIEDKIYKVYPVYYPVGQGMRNMEKAVEDIKYIQSFLSTRYL